VWSVAVVKEIERATDFPKHFPGDSVAIPLHRCHRIVMFLPRTLAVIAVLTLTVGIAPLAEAQQKPFLIVAPLGFRPIASEPGVKLWRRGRDYVQIVSPAQGATIALLHGDVIPSDGIGTNFARKNLRTWWEEWSAEEQSAFTLINAQFFNENHPRKSPLAFSTKMNGVVYVGYGDETEYKGRKMLLRIGESHAVIDEYNDDAGSLYTLPEPNIIVGLKPDVSKQGNTRRGRTFIGAMPGGDVLIFSSPAATQRFATRMLIAFGVDRNKIMMLDGGGSTQFIREGTLVIPEKKNGVEPYLRTLPLAIGVMKGQ
jgi:hypothetical protein